MIYSNHLNSLDEVITRTDVVMDNGAVRIDARSPMTVHLVEVRPTAAEGVVL